MNMSGQLSDYWTISPKLINELRIGFMGEYDVFHPATIGQGSRRNSAYSSPRQTFSRTSPSATITASAQVPPPIPSTKRTHSIFRIR